MSMVDAEAFEMDEQQACARTRSASLAGAGNVERQAS
jgi:hypothetical protein